MNINLESFDESFNSLHSMSNDLYNNSSFISTNEEFGIIYYPTKEISEKINYDETLFFKPSKSEIFEIKRKKDRGKQTKNSRKVKHISNSLDNVLTKIQVHFFSFIIDIANDALFTEFHEKNIDNFKGINHKIKSKFNHSLFEKYKKCRIKDILQLQISPKFKLSQIDHNKQLVNKVCNLSNWLDKFFDMNYLKLFNYYYNKQKPLNAIFFEGKEIKLSKKIKCFYNLIDKNKNNKNELIKIAESYYFNEDDAFFCIDKKE